MKVKTDKKIAFVFTYFSYLRAIIPLKKQFEKNGYQVELFNYQLEEGVQYISDFQKEKLGFHEDFKVINDISKIKNFDFALLAFGGGPLFNAIKKLKNAKSKLVTIYPGVRGKGDSDGLFARANSDLILFNNRLDLQNYKNFSSCFSLNCDNSIEFGFSKLIEQRPINISAENTSINNVYFLAQDKIVNSSQKSSIIEKLSNYAKKYPERNIFIVEKTLSNEVKEHVDNQPYKKLLSKYSLAPNNISITYDSLSKIFKNSDLCISISSAGIIESIFHNIKSVLISDFGISEKLGNTAYNDSNLFASFDDVMNDEVPYISENWKKEYVINAEDNLSQLFETLQKIEKTQNSITLKGYKNWKFNNRTVIQDKLKKLKKFIFSHERYLKESKYNWIKKSGEIIYGK